MYFQLSTVFRITPINRRQYVFPAINCIQNNSDQLHVISRSETIIKPASPTPLNLKDYNLPLYDCTVQNFYMPMLFLYPNNNSDHGSPQSMANTTTTTISNQLKNYLSETLAKYYPLAGRFTSETHVDCSDQGVEFVEVRIGCKLSEIQGNSFVKDDKFTGHLFPPRSIWDEMPSNQDYSLVRVQLNHFDCGGIAIAASMSHKIGDALTMFSFLRYWANLSLHSGDHKKLLHLRPHFLYDHMPQSCYHDDLASNLLVSPPKYWITKEIVFHNKKIEKLKATVEAKDKLDGVAEEQKYTRNELVTALLYKCVVAAATSNSGAYTPSVLFQPVNMRRMMEPTLPETSFGNLAAAPNHIPTTTESEIMLNNLVGRIKKGKMQLRGIKSPNEFDLFPKKLQEYLKSNHRVIAISSICNFPIYKEMDFGWGMPIEFSFVDTPFSDAIFLMDTASGDGIKAVVGLEEKDMEHFQNNPELLTYACFM